MVLTLPGSLCNHERGRICGKDAEYVGPVRYGLARRRERQPNMVLAEWTKQSSQPVAFWVVFS